MDDRGTATAAKTGHLVPATWLWSVIEGKGFSLLGKRPLARPTPLGLLTMASIPGRCTFTYVHFIYVTISTLKTDEKNHQEETISTPSLHPSQVLRPLELMNYLNLFPEHSCHLLALTRT